LMPCRVRLTRTGDLAGRVVHGAGFALGTLLDTLSDHSAGCRIVQQAPAVYNRRHQNAG